MPGKLQPRPGTIGVEALRAPPAGDPVEVGLGEHRRRVSVGGEPSEGRQQLRARAPARVMVELDVGDRRDGRAQLEEAGVRLVGLRDQPLPLAPGGVRGLSARAGATKLAADQKRRVGAHGPQRMDQHACRRRLAMRPGDRDRAPQRAELCEQLPAVDDALAALPRPHELGVVFSDRGRDDDLGPRGHELGIVADPRLEPGPA